MSTVIHVVQHLQPGGIETMALDLVSFRKKHEKTFIVSLEGTKQAAIKAWPRLKPYDDHLIFLNKKPGFAPLLITKLASLLIKLGVDAVHTHHIGPLIYGGLAARLIGISRRIHTEHDAWHLNDSYRRKIQKLLLRLINPILVADAQTVANNIKEQLDTDKVIVIPNGIDTSRFIPGNKQAARASLQLPRNIKIIGCGGRLERVKGQHILINALHKLPEDVHLALAGDGTMQSNLLNLAKSLQLEHRVHFLGRIDEMPTFYQSLDIFCLPSLNEGFPLSPLEAQSCGIPTLVTDVGGSKETLCLESGSLVPADDAPSMAKMLLKMINTHYQRSPRNFILDNGNVRLMADRYATLRQMEA
jgi:glycosyltransferase involved in cell wall biosynthesis